MNNKKINLKGKNREELIESYAKISKIFNDRLDNRVEQENQNTDKTKRK